MIRLLIKVKRYRQNYINIIEKRLLNAQNFTSIATHDDKIINHVKQFVKDHHIEKTLLNFKCCMVFVMN